ncbi:MAG: arylformamidase [Proteobacteria bacterium]|nr:MAG: arylformamidase [Pseudomonadota bacterium]
MTSSDPDDGWIDVSVPLHSGMVNWPGDPPVVITRTQAISDGDVANVTHLDLGAHTGTHMDAPLHFIDGAPSIDQAPLSALIGPARVLAFPDATEVTAALLDPHAPQPGERLLLRTRNSERSWAMERFDEGFVALSRDGAELLAERSVLTVGVDYLSVSRYHDDASTVHRTLLARPVWLIEGLNLTHVAPGPVDLICLPLRLAGADGAPARVALRPKSLDSSSQGQER